MRIAVIIIVILGSLFTMALGAKWVFDYNDGKQAIEALQQSSKTLGVDTSSFDELEKYKTGGYILIVCGLVALVTVFLIGKLGKIAAVIMLLAGIAPAFIDPATLIFTFFVILGGILCFFVKPKKAHVIAS